MPDITLPTPGPGGTPGPAYAEMINTAIDSVNDVIETGRLSETELSATLGSEAAALGSPLSKALLFPPVPSYAGSRARTWKQSQGLYNGESPDLLALRKLIRQGLQGSPKYLMMAPADSKFRGGGVEPLPTSEWSMPAQLTSLLGARPGLVYCNVDPTTGDSRWSNVSGFAQNPDVDKLYASTTSGGSVRYVSAPGETAVGYNVFAYTSTGTPTLKITVDGVERYSGTIGSGFPWKIRSITGLTDSVHTVLIELGGAGAVLGIEPIYSSAGLRISNGGRGGSAPAHWVANNAATVWATMFSRDGTGTSIPKPDAAVLGLATNGALSQYPSRLLEVATAVKALGIPVLMVAPGGNPDDATYNAKRAAAYSVADSLDLPLIDFAALIGTYPRANAAGLMTIDVHENQRGYAIEAAALAEVLSYR